MAKKEVDNLFAMTIEQPDDAVFKQSQKFLKMAEGFEIATPDQAIAAGEQLKEIKALAKEVENKRKEMTVPINQGLRKINDFFRSPKEWLSTAEIYMKTKILKYQQDQELIAQEAQRKADEKVRKKKERLEARAAAARIAGQEAKADKLEVDAKIQHAPVISSPAPKIKGVQTRTTWKANVTDKLELIKYVAENPSMIGLLNVDQSKLNGQARLMKEEFNIPGAEAAAEQSIAARS